MSDFFRQAEEMRQKAEEDRKSVQEVPQGEIINKLDQLQNIRDNTNKAEVMKQELYRRAIENIKSSEWNRIQINKNDFSDKDWVIDILLYTVGKMAQDPIFYKLNIAKLKDHTPIYTKEAE